MPAIDTEAIRAAVTTALVEARQGARTNGAEIDSGTEHSIALDVIRTWFETEATRRLLSGVDPIDEHTEARLTKDVVKQVLGMGGLQDLLDDPEVTDIHVPGCRPTWVRLRSGERRMVAPVVASDSELVDLIRSTSSRLGGGERRFDSASVECNLQLEDGSRLFAVMGVSTRPSVIVRKHQFELSDLSELSGRGLCSVEVADFLRRSVAARRNIIVAGGTGAGKTTLLRALLNCVEPDERIVTIEDAYELGIDRFSHLHPDHDALQTRAANQEGLGEITLADLTRMALRMDPDRVVVGEVRGAEAFPMLLAMSQGNDGSMCTLHADSSRSAFAKLAAYVTMAGHGLPVGVVNSLIAQAVHLVVHVSRHEGRRMITSIREVVDADGERIVSNEIFSSNDGEAARPMFPMSDALSGRLAAHSSRSLVSSNGVRT